MCSYTTAFASPYLRGSFSNVLRARGTFILISLDSGEMSIKISDVRAKAILNWTGKILFFGPITRYRNRINRLFSHECVYFEHISRRRV